MIDPSKKTSLAAMRLQIEGPWSVEEFQQMLLTLHDVYRRISVVITLGELIRQERRQNEALKKRKGQGQQDWSWSVLWGTGLPNRREIFTQPEPLSKVVAGIEPLFLPLGIDAIRLESPGWLQVIGNLNPLKVVADFISKWRAENTKRLQIHRAFALEILHQLPESNRISHANRLAELAEYAITPVTTSLQGLANDARILEAQVVRAGATLTKSRPPRRLILRAPNGARKNAPDGYRERTLSAG